METFFTCIVFFGSAIIGHNFGVELGVLAFFFGIYMQIRIKRQDKANAEMLENIKQMNYRS